MKILPFLVMAAILLLGACDNSTEPTKANTDTVNKNPSIDQGCETQVDNRRRPASHGKQMSCRLAEPRQGDAAAIGNSRRTDMQASVAPSARARDQLTIEPFSGTVTVRFSDAIVAATERAKVLREQGHEPVFYIPFEDMYFDLFEKTNTTSQCPLKGTASYWRVHAVGSSADDIMWAYEMPDSAARSIARHGAFDSQKARIDVDPAEDKRHTPHVTE